MCLCLKAQGDPSLCGMPLFLGQVKSRPPPQYTAILAYRPDKAGRGVDAIVASNLTSSSPLFSILLEGRILTLVGYEAVFHVVLMLLQYHKLKYNGMLGPGYLSDEAMGGLANVVDPTEEQPGVPQHGFNWWSR